MVGGGISVILLVARTVAVSGVAFHDGAIDFKDKVLDEFGFQVVGVAALASADFDSYAPLGRHAQGFVDVDQRFGADVLGQIDDRFLLFS